jgi:cathepsin B
MRSILLAVFVAIFVGVFTAEMSKKEDMFEVVFKKGIYTVADQCLTNALNLCADDAINHKQFTQFTNAAKLIATIKSKTSLWKADHNKFSTKTDEELNFRAGALADPKIPIDHTFVPRKLLTALPASFDSRKKWPKCVGIIRNQGNCGSCWAYSGTSTLADRVCVATKGKSKNILMSPQELVSCSNNGGCAGGYATKFWEYANATGVVSESCLSYKSNNKGSTTNVGSCPAKCDNKKTLLNKASAYYSTKTQYFKGVPAIKAELMARGPLMARLVIHKDFFSYKKGIYHHVSGPEVGGHFIRLIGWGYDKKSKTEYWICANSWGTSWGENGFFRIRMGDSNINDEVQAGTYTLRK